MYIEPSKTTISNWLRNWLKDYKSIKLKPTTYDCYEKLIEKHMIPEFGDFMLKDLKSNNIQRFYNNIYKNGNCLSSATVRKIHTILKSALDQAVTNDLLYKNPANDTELPELKQKEIKVFTIQEQKRFIIYAEGYRLYSAFIVQLDTGLRLGEILALEWQDVELTKGIINVNKNIVLVKNRNEDDERSTELIVQNSTKTKNGKRKIPLTQRSILLLKELKLKQQAKSNIVFCSEKGTHVSPRNYERTIEKVIKKANIEKCNSHTLRHTYATRLFENGVAAKTVSELLGHANISITLNIYTHVLPETRAETARILDKLYSDL
jgi:integrase